MTILAKRSGLTGVDGAQVIGQPVPVDVGPEGVLGTFRYTVAPAAATINVRAKIQVSTDGVVWHDIARFIDQTDLDGAGAERIARLPSVAAAAESAVTDTNLTTAAGAAVLSDVASGRLLMRAVTMLQTLTGGGTPTVGIVVSASAREAGG